MPIVIRIEIHGIIPGIQIHMKMVWGFGEFAPKVKQLVV